MLIKDLIKKLEELYQQGVPHIPIFGEPTIEIDVFKVLGTGGYIYAGIHTGDIKFGKSPDGVYDVMSAFMEDYPES